MSKKRRHPDFKEFEKELLKDPKVKLAYDRLQPDYAVVEAFLKRAARDLNCHLEIRFSAC